MTSTAARTTATPTGRTRTNAVIAGTTVLAMAPLGMFANVVILTLASTAPEDTAATVAESRGLLGLAVAAFLAVAVLDIVAAWALARFFGGGLATLAAWFRVIYAGILVVAASGLSVLVTALDSGSVSGAAARSALATFTSTWQLGLVIFAGHLAVLALLVMRHTKAPTVLGGVIAVAAIAYATDGVARLFLPADSTVLLVLTGIVATSSIIGEIGFALWLLIRGGRRP